VAAPPLVGTFDPARIRSFSPLSEVPLGGYQPVVAAPATPASRRALHGADLLPHQNLGGYVTQPVNLITSLSALPVLQNSGQYDGDLHGSDPISVIRVRVAVVTGPNPTSLERIREAAQQIAHLGSWERDLATGTTRWSSELFRLLGYRQGAVEPSREAFLASVHQDDLARVARSQDDVRDNRWHELDFRTGARDGVERVLQSRVNVVYDADGTPQFCGLPAHHTCPHRMDCPRCGLFIGGETVEGSESRELVEPATGEPLATVQLAGEARGRGVGQQDGHRAHERCGNPGSPGPAWGGPARS